MYTFSPKHFAKVIEIIDSGGDYTELWTLKDALRFAQKEDKKEIRKLHKDKLVLTQSRCAVLSYEFSMMGKVSVRRQVFKIDDRNCTIPFIKFWPNKQWEEYWQKFDRKRLVENI